MPGRFKLWLTYKMSLGTPRCLDIGVRKHWILLLAQPSMVSERKLLRRSPCCTKGSINMALRWPRSPPVFHVHWWEGIIRESSLWKEGLARGSRETQCRKPGRPPGFWQLNPAKCVCVCLSFWVSLYNKQSRQRNTNKKGAPTERLTESGDRGS